MSSLWLWGLILGLGVLVLWKARKSGIESAENKVLKNEQKIAEKIADVRARPVDPSTLSNELRTGERKL